MRDLPEASIAGREETWLFHPPDLSTVAVPRCGHLPHDAWPEAVNDALLAFSTAGPGSARA